jgi:CheY-like chemotaxis protein
MNQNNQTRKILVVDDDPVIRDMMADILEFEGYTISIARNGYEALQLLRGEKEYIVFLDMMMPAMSGKELCAVIETDPLLSERHRIILMSAMDNLEEAASLQVDAILQKPFVVEDVIDILEPYLGSGLN